MADDDGGTSRSYFLSYSRSDEHFALRLANDIRAHGITIWVDQLDIRPSEHWDRAIERAVASCSGLVVILSPRSVASDNVADEISFAIDNGKSVLPVMIEKCVLPLRITRMQVVDATSNYDKALQQCLAELTRSATHPPAQPTRAAVFDAESLSTAKRRLTHFLGPIAGKVVEQAAARASSVEGLYGLLAERIADDADRQRFLSQAPVPRATSATGLPPAAAIPDIPVSEIESLAKALTVYLGPIAPIVAKRESRACASIADLRQRLAALIPQERDRSAFLQRLDAL